MTREMLDASHDSGILQTLQIVRYHRGSHLGIVRERTVTDDDVVGVRVHVSHWCKVNVETIFPQIGANHVTRMISVFRVTRFANITHRTNHLHVEVLVLSNAGNATAFLIDAQHRLSFQLTNV